MPPPHFGSAVHSPLPPVDALGLSVRGNLLKGDLGAFLSGLTPEAPESHLWRSQQGGPWGEVLPPFSIPPWKHAQGASLTHEASGCHKG